VNTASGLSVLRPGLEGAEPTSLAQPLPSHLGLSSRRPVSFFRLSPGIPVLSMNYEHLINFCLIYNDFLYTVY